MGRERYERGRGRRRLVAELDPLSPPEVHLCGHGRLGQGPRQPRAAVVGLTVGGDAPSLGEYLGAWLSHLKGRVRARTYHGYECLIRLYVKPHLSEVPLAELHPLALQELYAWLMQGKVPPISAGAC